MRRIKYRDSAEYVGEFTVVFMVKETGAVLERGFTTPREALDFARKIRFGKRCELLSCPSEEGYE